VLRKGKFSTRVLFISRRSSVLLHAASRWTWSCGTDHRTAMARLRASIDSRGAHPGRSETQAVGHTVTLPAPTGGWSDPPSPSYPHWECRRSGPTQKPTSAKFDDDSPTTPDPLLQQTQPSLSAVPRIVCLHGPVWDKGPGTDHRCCGNARAHRSTHPTRNKPIVERRFCLRILASINMSSTSPCSRQTRNNRSTVSNLSAKSNRWSSRSASLMTFD
jgi:hypothetical protein